MYKIGYVGLGSMGFKMSVMLMQKGFEVIGFNRTKSKEEELAKMGASRVASLVELAETCDVIMACLPDDNVIRQTIFGEQGLLKSSNPRFKYFIDCSTIDVDAAVDIGAKLKEKDIYYFDSPVSGGPKAAESGTLTLMVGGDKDALDKVMPVYNAIGTNILYFGPNGSSTQVKLINQILAWVNHAVICEAAVLAKKAGMDLDKMYDALITSFGASRVLEVTFKTKIQHEDYTNPTGMAMMYKDLTLAQKFAERNGAIMPMTETAMKLYSKAIADGHGNKDQCIIMEQLK